MDTIQFVGVRPETKEVNIGPLKPDTEEVNIGPSRIEIGPFVYYLPDTLTHAEARAIYYHAEANQTQTSAIWLLGKSVYELYEANAKKSFEDLIVLNDLGRIDLNPKCLTIAAKTASGQFIGTSRLVPVETSLFYPGNTGGFIVPTGDGKFKYLTPQDVPGLEDSIEEDVRRNVTPLAWERLAKNVHLGKKIGLEKDYLPTGDFDPKFVSRAAISIMFIATASFASEDASYYVIIDPKMSSMLTKLLGPEGYRDFGSVMTVGLSKDFPSNNNPFVYEHVHVGRIDGTAIRTTLKNVVSLYRGADSQQFSRQENMLAMITLGFAGIWGKLPNIDDL